MRFDQIGKYNSLDLQKHCSLVITHLHTVMLDSEYLSRNAYQT